MGKAEEKIGSLFADFDFDKWDAYFILTQVGRVRLGNMVDPNYTIGAFIEKKYLPDRKL